MAMKQIAIGIYPLGHENVQLLALPDETGGEFHFCPDETSLGRIKVGLANADWSSVVAVLLHETMEYAMDRHRVRYRASNSLTNDHAGYQFNLSHRQFTEICACVATFITPALPDLAKAWGKRHKTKQTKP